MQPNTSQRPAERLGATAKVINLEAERSLRLRFATAEPRAVRALASFEAGETSFQRMMAALIAPFAEGDPGLGLQAASLSWPAGR